LEITNGCCEPVRIAARTPESITKALVLAPCPLISGKTAISQFIDAY